MPTIRKRPSCVRLTLALVLATATVLAPVAAQGAPEPRAFAGLAAPAGLRPMTPWTEVKSECCKTCRKGKACGNSCISREKTCRKGPGCACDAR